MFHDFTALASEISGLSAVHRCGRVVRVGADALMVAGLRHHARLGHRVVITRRDGGQLAGEVVALAGDVTQVMTFTPCDGVALGDTAQLVPSRGVQPCDAWIGRVIDATGQPMDGRALARGVETVQLRAAPPPAASRRAMGARVATGIAAFDTMLPLARGQRIGLFAGSGIGKSTLLAELARRVKTDVVVLALIGERGRELKHFIDNVLGEEGMARSVVVAATSDQSPLLKRRAAWLAMSVAEYFRDQGKHVLLLVDSVTRFAEAHREVALTAGETPSLRAYPPSTAGLIANLAERAGPGPEGKGDITGIFSVLVAGSDMEEPVADMTRGILDGHVILDREIAERGRFPAIDVRRSLSRSLPDVATAAENRLIARARHILGTYDAAAPMIQTGLYVAGSDPQIDEAIALWPLLDAFFSRTAVEGVATAFTGLNEILSGGAEE